MPLAVVVKARARVVGHLVGRFQLQVVNKVVVAPVWRPLRRGRGGEGEVASPRVLHVLPRPSPLRGASIAPN